ncbi:actinin, putative [Trichomonas vaginalis G3]|uniref:Actinin, putative n=1 Tax=Trichomonas vaginalis (strain ATCC PRA-98 / G3) TaxID=412133 RepID=A2DGG1_TRIV3|nr:alpha actinin-3 [Trichomonas vaginalis G3]EAY20557.1 actinin, putative [Trichomonas vaginalis G3]KAI5488248.1 alpha actinin-3 [Trichomonas vaginalis G3]|eukprot:XP_001581543.1 actinin [Trichomonas vaginalis G3]
MSNNRGLLDDAWEQTQIKVFSRWTAKQLSFKGIPFDNVLEEFADGVKLIQLLEIVSKEPMKGKWHKQPKMRVQMRENCGMALDFISSKNIRMVGIGSDDIIDKNKKLTLGLIWTIINKFMIEEISVEEATARDALLLWAKKNTQGYKGVNVTNFTTSWSDGLAFCALINKFRPNMLDYDSLDQTQQKENCEKAFAACKELGIYVFLDPEDLVGTQPDEKSVVTQVAEFFHFFAGESKTQAAADKLKRTIGIQKAIEEEALNYEKQAQECLDVINTEREKLLAQDYDQTVPGVKSKLFNCIKFGRVVRPVIVDKRGVAMKTWGQLVTKCNSNGRPIPQVKEELLPPNLNLKFEEIEKTASDRRDELTKILEELQAKLIKAFDEAANAKIAVCDDINNKAINLTGDLYEQRDALNNYLQQAQEAAGTVKELQPQFVELVELRLNNRVKRTVIAVDGEFEQLIATIKRLIEGNKAAIFEYENKKKIEEYNQAAQKYVDEVAQLKQDLEAIAGELREQRAANVDKSEEIIQKRNGVSDIRPMFQELEKQSLHLGIENTPDAVTAMYTACLSQAQDKITQISKQLVDEYNEKAIAIHEKIGDVHKTADSVSGTTQEKKDGVLKCQSDLTEIKASIQPTLEEPYQYLQSIKYSNAVKYTPNDLTRDSDITFAFLTTLLNQLEEQLQSESNDARIAAYNELAKKYVDIANEFHQKVSTIDGDRATRRNAYLSAQLELGNKREGLSQLKPEYEALERDTLHIRVNDSPATISKVYANALQIITDKLAEIYNEMVADFDAQVLAIAEKVKVVQNVELTGTLLELKDKIAQSKAQAQEILPELPTLDAPWEDLCDFNLNYRVKQTPENLRATLEAVIAFLNHQEESNNEKLASEGRESRIFAYNQKAAVSVALARELEQKVSNVDGTLPEKQQKLFDIKQEVIDGDEAAKELTPIFEDLEKDELHLAIEDTPDSIAAFFANILSHIDGLVREIDTAIAAEKGLQISEEQLTEFRETFNHFDKDHTNFLQYFELRACLTALGDDISDDQAKEVCKKYSATGEEKLNFDEYVKFMLDHFSKAENADTTAKAFKAIANNNPILTDAQLDQYFKGEEAEYLRKVLKQVDGGYEFAEWVNSIYA